MERSALIAAGATAAAATFVSSCSLGGHAKATAGEVALGAGRSSTKEVLAQLRAGGEQSETMLQSMLERSLEMLDSATMGTPRRGRKALLALSERVEDVLESVDEALVQQLAECGVSELEALRDAVCSVERLQGVESVGPECTDAVAQALEELARCSDPVLVAIGQLGSGSVGERQRGLAVLSGLAREPLASWSSTEVSAAEAVLALLAPADDGGAGMTLSEQTTAWLSLFAFAIRNGTEGSVSVWTSDAMVQASEVPRELGAGKADDREVAILAAVQLVSSVGGWELCLKSTAGPERDAYCKARDISTFSS
jgi:hypothetical protein